MMTDFTGQVGPAARRSRRLGPLVSVPKRPWAAPLPANHAALMSGVAPLGCQRLEDQRETELELRVEIEGGGCIFGDECCQLG